MTVILITVTDHSELIVLMFFILICDKSYIAACLMSMFSKFSLSLFLFMKIWLISHKDHEVNIISNPDSNNRQVKVSLCCSFAFLLLSYLIVLLLQCFAYFLVMFGHKKTLEYVLEKITFQLQIPVSVATNMTGNCLLNSLLKI